MLWTEGFDCWEGSTDFATKYATRSGTWSFSSGYLAGQRAGSSSASFDIPAVIPKSGGFCLGFRFQHSSGGSVTRVTLDPATNKHFFIENGSGKFRVARNLPSDGSVTIVAETAISVSTWYYAEWIYLPSTTTGGIAIFKLNGTTIYTESGGITENSTSLLADPYSMRFVTSNFTNYFDDIYLLAGTTPIGEKVVRGIKPTANGDTNQFTPSAGSNWDCVDALGTDNVTSTTSGHVDVYSYEDLSSLIDIEAVHAHTILKESSLGTENLKTLYREGSTNYADSAQAINSTTDVMKRRLMTVNPATGNPFTMAEINAGQFGVELA